MRTKKQKKASSRNWNKGCLRGIKAHLTRMQRVDSGLTKKEITKITAIKVLVRELLIDWD